MHKLKAVQATAPIPPANVETEGDEVGNVFDLGAWRLRSDGTVLVRDASLFLALSGRLPTPNDDPPRHE